MKNIKNIIFIITLICISIFTTNVNAEVIDINSCHFTISGPEYPVKDYPLYTQKLVCGNRSFDFYCIDAGIPNPSNAKNMNISYLQSSGLDSILAQGNGLTYFQKQVALRKWAHKVGLNTYYTTAMKNVVENKFSGQTFQAGWARGNAAATDLRTIQVSGDTVFTLLVTNVTRDESGNFTATISVSPLDSSINLSRVSWSSSNASVSRSSDGKTLTVSGTMQECKGKKVKLRADVSNARTDGNPGNGGNDGTPGDDGTPYIYLVPQSGRVQAGIVHVIGSGIRFTDGTPGNDGNEGEDGEDGSDGSNNVYKFTINIPDPNCDCGADYSGAFKCDGSGRSTEYLRETSNILSCIISGNYNDYCNSSIEKKTDNNGSSQKTANLSNKVGSYSVVLSDNNYCKVYCKEDIDYSLPGKIKANNGRYFTLRDGLSVGDNDAPIKLTGTRSCYTDEINISQFKIDVTHAQRAVETAYKNYQEAKAKKASQDDLEKTDKSSCTYNGNCNATGSDQAGTDGEWYVGKEKEYKYYKLNINSDGTLAGKSIMTGKVKEEWGTKYTATSTASCNIGTQKKPNIVTGTSCSKTTVEKTEIDVDAYKAAVDQAQENLNTILKKYKSCYEWNNNYCFEPEVTFSYEDGETYERKNVNNQKLKGSTTTYDDSKVFGYKDVSSDEQYNADGSSITFNNKDYIYFNGSNLEEQSVKVNLTQNYIKKISKAEKTFDKSTVKVCTYHPVGTIITGDSCDDGKNTITLGADGYVFPISLQKKESRQYNYELKFANIGVDGNDGDDVRGSSCKGGRLMGCQNGQDVYTSTTKKKEAKYVCQYSNCPECNVVCECPADNPSCYVDEEGECRFVRDCPTCTVECEGCLWNDGDVTFGYKQVSLSDMFPNSDTTEVGYNWNTSDNNPEHNKASATIKDIESKKEQAYTTPEYSYTLNPATMASIRSYNKEANKDSVSSVKWGDNISIPNGGYNNDTLTCTNGEKCESSFLDGLDDMGNVTNKRSTKWKVFNKTTNKWEVK